LSPLLLAYDDQLKEKDEDIKKLRVHLTLLWNYFI